MAARVLYGSLRGSITCFAPGRSARDGEFDVKVLGNLRSLTIPRSRISCWASHLRLSMPWANWSTPLLGSSSSHQTKGVRNTATGNLIVSIVGGERSERNRKQSQPSSAVLCTALFLSWICNGANNGRTISVLATWSIKYITFVRSNRVEDVSKLVMFQASHVLMTVFLTEGWGCAHRIFQWAQEQSNRQKGLQKVHSEEDHAPHGLRQNAKREAGAAELEMGSLSVPAKCYIIHEA